VPGPCLVGEFRVSWHIYQGTGDEGTTTYSIRDIHEAPVAVVKVAAVVVGVDYAVLDNFLGKGGDLVRIR
jgi:hypothetical protein